LPEGHDWQADDEFMPTAEEKEPLGQEKGVTILIAGQNEPAGQRRKLDAADAGQYAPAGQALQSK
jgi:hypothetical protein